MKLLATHLLIGLGCAMWVAPSHAQSAAELHRDKCAACHQAKVAVGDGNQLYTRSDRKVTSLEKLKSQIALCNTELRLDLFPEDELALLEHLNQQFYKFKQ